MASPRDLDPKFKSESPETVPPNENTPATGDERSAEQTQREEKRHDDDTPMIVHRQRVFNPDGSIGEKVHGPMPVADWAEYEKENGL